MLSVVVVIVILILVIMMYDHDADMIVLVKINGGDSRGPGTPGKAPSTLAAAFERLAN